MRKGEQGQGRGDRGAGPGEQRSLGSGWCFEMERQDGGVEMEEASWERGGDEGWSSGPVTREGKQGQGRGERGAGGSSGPSVRGARGLCFEMRGRTVGSSFRRAPALQPSQCILLYIVIF